MPEFAETFPVTLCFNGVKRSRNFAFLPRIGDRLNITDPDGNETYALDVKCVWFDDDYGHSLDMGVFVNCDLAATNKA